MFSRPHIRFISLLAILFAIAQANWVQPRQGGLISDLSSILVGGDDPTSSESSTSAPPTSTPSPTSQSSSSIPETSTSEPPTSTTPTSSPSSTPSPTSSTPSSTSQDPTSTSSSRDESTTEPPKSTPSPSVVVVTTVIDGSTSSYQSTMSTLPTTSGSPSNGASLDSSNKSSSSGMSSQTKRTVIGVVVGVGGAIVLAGLFVVAWRIWGRKKSEDESDGLMGYRGGSAGHEKSGSISTAPSSNPFQTTLDQYHAPNRPVNASSNF